MHTSPFHVDLKDEGTGVCEQDKHTLDSVSLRAVFRAGTEVCTTHHAPAPKLSPTYESV